MTMRAADRAQILVTLAVLSAPGSVLAQSQDGCTMAGTSVRVESAESGTGRRTLTYTVINNRAESLRWVRIGSGGHTQTRVVAEQRPEIASSPGLWRGAVVYPEGTSQFHILWEAMDGAAALARQSRATFGIEVNGPEAVPRGRNGPDGRPIHPLYFPTLPFTVGGDGGCWWGWTIAPGDHSPAGGLAAGTTMAVVRPFTDGDRDYVIVDAPAFENHMRLANGVYLSIPITFSWGVKGGFSHNASIGVGLRWSPVEYVSVYAQTHVGTFFFTNRTHLRHVGVDVNIPRYTTSTTSGTIRRDEYLVFGVEYFDRHAVELAGYMDGPQWYAGGRGIAVRVGIRGVVWDR
jgi:hypothetical protein